MFKSLSYKFANILLKNKVIESYNCETYIEVWDFNLFYS